MMYSLKFSFLKNYVVASVLDMVVFGSRKMHRRMKMNKSISLFMVIDLHIKTSAFKCRRCRDDSNLPHRSMLRSNKKSYLFSFSWPLFISCFSIAFVMPQELDILNLELPLS